MIKPADSAEVLDRLTKKHVMTVAKPSRIGGAFKLLEVRLMQAKIALISCRSLQ